MLESVYSRHNELVERSQAQSQISHYSVDTVLEERLIEELEYDIENVHRELENMQCMTMNSLHNQSLNYHYGHIQSDSHFSMNQFLDFSELDFDQNERVCDLTRHQGIMKKNVLSQDVSGIYGDIDLHMVLDKEEFGEAVTNYIETDGTLDRLRKHIKENEAKDQKDKQYDEKNACVCELCGNLGIIYDGTMALYKRPCGHVLHGGCCRILMNKFKFDEEQVRDECPLCYLLKGNSE